MVGVRRYIFIKKRQVVENNVKNIHDAFKMSAECIAMHTSTDLWNSPYRLWVRLDRDQA